MDFIRFDPPRRDLHLNLVRSLFSPPAVAALGPVARDRENSLLDRIERDKLFDVGEAFSFPLPLYLIAHARGLPRADLDCLGPKVIAFLDRPANGGHVDSHSIGAGAEVGSHLTVFAKEHRKECLDDLRATISSSEAKGRPFTDGELGSCRIVLFKAGVDTTNTLIMSVLYRLEQNLRQKRLLASDRSLIPIAVEEAAGFDAPPSKSSAWQHATQSSMASGCPPALGSCSSSGLLIVTIASMSTRRRSIYTGQVPTHGVRGRGPPLPRFPNWPGSRRAWPSSSSSFDRRAGAGSAQAPESSRGVSGASEYPLSTMDVT